MEKRKAISLLSGGLDSALATRLILDQGVDVLGLHLSSPFGCHEDVASVAASLGIPLKIIPKEEAYLDLIRHPKFGYGKNMNPCIDCRIYMFQIAHKLMQDVGADFIITGEVLGQRPMSQRREAMEIIDEESEMEALILRPLSAKHLPPTKPEQEGWVDRDALLTIAGRGRGEQLALAEALHLSGYSAPAGGCLLTDSNFSKKLALFFKTRTAPTMTEARLLRYGRFFNLGDETFALLGRNEEENDKLEEISREDVDGGRLAFFKPVFSGPSAVLAGDLSATFFNEVMQLIVRYSKNIGDSDRRIDIRVGETLTFLPVPHGLSFELPVVAL